MSGDRPRRSSDIVAPQRPLKDLRDRVHIRMGRSLRSRMLMSQKVASNGQPEPRPYRWRGTPAWSPASIDMLVREEVQRAAERDEWAREHAELVTGIRAQLASRSACRNCHGGPPAGFTCNICGLKGTAA